MHERPSSPAAAMEPALPWYWRLAVPYLRREGPMWGQLYKALGGYREGRWRNAGIAWVRGKLHGYGMDLDLTNWSERLTWCLGRYHDLAIQLALQRVLRPGDCFIDIGANLGMLSLLGHRLVGETGSVIACEPNPRLFERLQALIRQNELHVQLVTKALGEAPGKATLSEFAEHSGWGSLVSTGPAGVAKTATWPVEVTTGDEVLADVPAGRPMVIKIDVEGFEVPVLRGLQRTLATRRPLVIVELADAHQRRAGFSAAELRGALERHGYRGLALSLHRRGWFGRDLDLAPIGAGSAPEIDALFVPPDGPASGRVPFPAH